jgi:hypothetical protein
MAMSMGSACRKMAVISLRAIILFKHGPYSKTGRVRAADKVPHRVW